MSNKKLSLDSPRFGSGFAVYESVPESLVGRVLPIIEAMGLKDSQERAVKDMIRNTIYTVFFDENKPVRLDEGLHSFIREKYYDKKRAKKDNEALSAWLKLEDIK
jgi:pantothenate synthetase